MDANKALNSIAGFMTDVQHGYRTVKTDLVAAKTAIQQGMLKDLGYKRGLTELFSGFNWKTKLLTGGLTAGGIGLASWGVYKMFDDEDIDQMNRLGSHFLNNIYGTRA